MMSMTIKVKKKYKGFSKSFVPNTSAGHLQTLSPIQVRFSESYREMTNSVIHHLRLTTLSSIQFSSHSNPRSTLDNIKLHSILRTIS